MQGGSSVFKSIRSATVLLAFLAGCSSPEPESKVTSILNEGVMVEQGDTKVLFDPLYDYGFETFPEMSDELKAAIESGKPPWHGVDAVFISHFHEDHFSVPSLLRMMAAQPEVRFFMPTEALDALKASPDWSDRNENRITALALESDGPAFSTELGDLTIEAVRTPHIGWPEVYTNLQNFIFRLSFSRGGRVIHMGDADNSPEHFHPHEHHFQASRSHIAFAPYWYFQTPEGVEFVEKELNVSRVVGVHLPIIIPDYLQQSDADYFTDVGQILPLPEED